MNEHSISSQPATPLPADNPKRPIKVARPSIEQGLPHIGLVGDTYTILLSGEDTNGRYCLIDMHTHRLRGEGTASFSRKSHRPTVG